MAIRMFGAIDVGSFELEIGIYEISSKLGIHEVDHVRHGLALGKDTYSDGKISYELVEEMCQVLNKFVEVMKAYQVEDYYAYATSAMREAKNSQIVLDQIRVRTGLVIKAISNSELRFMSYKAVASKDVEFNKIVQKGTAIADLGFGSLQISLFDKGNLVSTQNIFLGSLRIREMLAHLHVEEKKVANLVEEMIDNELYTFKKMYLKDRDIKNLIATGESILYLAKKMLRETSGGKVTADQFQAFYERLLSMSLDEIEDYFELDTEYALLMLPSVVIYHRLLALTGAEMLWIPGIRLCDGIAAEFAESAKIVRFKHNFVEDILCESRNIAKRYKCHPGHTAEMERCSLQIFDSMKKYHGLGERHRLLLQISAILHSCGKFVSFLHSTDSSYRIIMSTEIIGISHLEREIIANVVKYNIQTFDYKDVKIESDLSQYESGYISKNDITILIAKLTAILRIANSLDRSHKQKFFDSRMTVKKGQLVITTDCPDDITLELAAFAQKADFFEEIFGIFPVLKQKRGL